MAGLSKGPPSFTLGSNQPLDLGQPNARPSSGKTVKAVDIRTNSFPMLSEKNKIK